jgi:methylmalonyl-CoA mutase N-terminal domain/subunit
MFDPKKIAAIREAQAKEGFSENSADFFTDSGVPIKALYAPTDISEIDYVADLGFPGKPPFTRGVYPQMYRKQLWTFRQVCGYGTAEETNERLRFLNQSGQTGLNVVPDTPTIYGLDSDAPLSVGEVGREGVAIDSLEDMRDLWAGIPLDQVSTSIIYNYPILFCMYLAVAQERGIPFSSLAGTLQNDPFTIIAGAKSWITTPRGSLRLCVDIIEFCAQYLPRFNPVSVVGYHYREAGCTAAQEIGFTMAAGLAYVKAGVERGLNVDDFAHRISFFYNAHNDFFEEIAKMRAARRLWCRLMTERFHPQNPRSTALRFHTQTAGSSLTAQQPLNNIIRTTIQALAAILGGTQSLHTNSYDEALGLPSENAVKIALRTQQILAHESNVTRTIDPLAGSYFIEAFTRDLENKALEIVKKIDDLGGMLPAVEKNFIQQAITEAALKKQQRVDSGEEKVVGINDFVEPGEKLTIEIMRVPPELERKQIERLNTVRRKRDESQTQKALRRLEEVARQGENTIPATVEAVKALATIGEIGALYRKVFGTYSDPGL